MIYDARCQLSATARLQATTDFNELAAPDGIFGQQLAMDSCASALQVDKGPSMVVYLLGLDLLGYSAIHEIKATRPSLLKNADIFPIGYAQVIPL